MWILDHLQAQRNPLPTDLKEFIREHDWEHRNEPAGASRTRWFAQPGSWLAWNANSRKHGKQSSAITRKAIREAGR
jgi:hypothetical protein